MNPWPDDLLALPHRRDVPFSRLTTLGVGGTCRWLFEPVEEAQAAAFVRACAREGIPFKVLGGGSNLVVLGDVEIPVVRLRLPAVLRREGCEVEAPASYGHMRLAADVAAMGLSGMEYASGIPGTVGGALRMNAGAYGRELVDVLARCRYVAPDGEIVDAAPAPGEFAYRRGLPGDRLALGLRIRLAEGDPAAIRERVEACRSRRGSSQPLGRRNAGCIFRNPPGTSAGRLIDEAGLKGTRIGDAQVSLEHANFLVNLGAATPAEFGELMALVRERVRDHHGVDLEPEVEIW
ncbi:UDP-N-acetylmuramate dehydrogenase [Mesoterricola sediminis]|uniref:UDP-N-acetylenolpyruvoylglucosamine reductase n=1 Tax=Mesoterricola sediminis TaxID=2927980 RepID=A0AA48KDE8_9BACT|nr:UDP-N-acetylmuramate dehydrogenase [Mesoterricola sediminis]BDU78229.1 UDP-N-acetylenolpyruvoylglucosamine reductase [Mesoterricola sediminis]